MSEIDVLKDILEQVGVCPVCVDQGFYSEPSAVTGEPVQVQCQWCDEHDSLFNRDRRTRAAERLATIAEVRRGVCEERVAYRSTWGFQIAVLAILDAMTKEATDG